MLALAALLKITLGEDRAYMGDPTNLTNSKGSHLSGPAVSVDTCQKTYWAKIAPIFKISLCDFVETTHWLKRKQLNQS